ncbi:MAG: hypothetical protein Q6352_015205 [Candidatus Freyrarchaeum guaymaensis]
MKTFLKLLYYGAIMFAVALGISFAVRLIQTGVNACFNGSLVGLLYILAVYVAIYLLARFVFNRWFSRSSLIVAIAGFANVSYGLIGLGSFHGVHPAVTVALEASAAAFFIVARRGTGEMSLTPVRREFPGSVLADAILDDCAVFKSGWRGFQVLQFAEVRGSGTGGSVLLSAWKAGINLSFEAYRRGDRLFTLISVWEISRDFDEAVARTRRKMSVLRAVLEREGYETRLISDELEVERCLYSPLLAPNGNLVGELDKRYLESLNVNELRFNPDVKLVMERVLDGEALGEESVGYVVLLQPVRSIDKEFEKAEKELKRKIERLVSSGLKKNDPSTLMVMLSMAQEKSLILQPGLERELTEARIRCQRMIDARSCGLWNASLFLIGRGGDVTRVVGRVNTEKSGEYVYSLVRRRRYSEKRNSEEVSELIPIRKPLNSSREESCEEGVLA